MKWECQSCKQTFRRFSKGVGKCPKCGFVPSWEADGYDDDAEVLEYWDFRPIFELRKWIRRQVKLALRELGIDGRGR